MILCVRCGSENRENASFCLNCGNKLDHLGEPSHSAEPETDQPSLAPVTPEPAADTAPGAGRAAEELADRGTEEVDAEIPAPEQVSPAAADTDQAPSPEEHCAQTIPEPELLLPDQEYTAALAANEPELPDANGQADQAAESDKATPTMEPAEHDGEPEPSSSVMPPLEPGTVLGDRFEIVDVLEESETTVLYDAIDRARCVQCGYPDSLPDDLYCESCGAMLSATAEAPHVHLCGLRIAGEAIIQLDEDSEGRIERWLEADGQLFAVLPLPPAQSEQESTPFARGVRHVVGYNSDIGRRRELDEDALLVLTLAPLFESRCRPSLGLYAVADGMGGHEGGEVASRLAIEGLAETVAKRLFLAELSGEPVLPETAAATLREAFELASARICDLQQSSGSDMGTTLTAALIRDDLAVVANVGDSRTYHWRDSQLTQITTDHSLVAQLVAAEMIHADDIYDHPEKSAIYRSLGHTPDVEVDIFTQSLLPGDRLVLCCDGVWEMLRDEGIEDVLLLEADPQRACNEIVRRSNLAGGDDNITVIVVQFEELEGA